MSNDDKIEVEGWCKNLQINATTGLTEVEFAFVTPPAEHIPFFVANFCKKWKIELPLSENQEEESPS